MQRTRRSISGAINQAQNIALGNPNSADVPDISGNLDVNSLITDTEVALTYLAETGTTTELFTVLPHVKVCGFKSFPEYVQTPKFCVTARTFIPNVCLSFKIHFLENRSKISVSAKYIMHEKTIVVTSQGIKKIIDSATQKVSIKFSDSDIERVRKLQEILYNIEQEYKNF